MAALLACAAMVAAGVAALVWALGAPARPSQAPAPVAEAETVREAAVADRDDAVADWDVERAREACKKVVACQKAGAKGREGDLEALTASDDASAIKVAWGSADGHEGGITVDFAVGDSDGGLVPCVFYARRDATGEADAVVEAVYDADKEGFVSAELAWSQIIDASMVDGDTRQPYERYEGLGTPDPHDEYAKNEAAEAAPDGLDAAGAARAAAMAEAGRYDGMGADSETEEGGK